VTDAEEGMEQPGPEGTQPVAGAAPPNPAENPSGPARYAIRPASPLAFGLAFAILGALMAVQPLASTTYLKLFYEKGGQMIQPPLPEGVPVPRSLVWPPGLYSFIERFGTLTSAAVLGLTLVFGLCFLYGLFRILNPTFRMTTGVDWDRNLLHKTYMHSEPITKAFLIAIAALIPAFVLWQAVGWALRENAFSLWLRLALSGAAFWYLFSRDGIAGDYETGSYEPPRDRSVRRSLLIRGCLAGTLAWLMLRLAPALDTDDLFSLYRDVGFIGPGQWQQIALITLGFAALFGFAAGGLATALGTPDGSAARRARAAVLPGIVLLAAGYLGRIWLPSYFQAHYDYVATSRMLAEQRLAQIAHLSSIATPQTAYLVDVSRALPVRFSGRSVTEIAATPENARAIDTYLQAHHNRTALSYPAYTTLHDAALLGWSVDDTLRVYLRNLAGAPDMAYVSHLLNKVQGSAFSPTSGLVAALDRLADGRYFDYTDRRAWVMTGDLYARFGLRAKAEECYRRAEMPASQVGLRAEERTLKPDGKVTGRLLFGGNPVPGARVALLSEQAVMQVGNMTDAGTHMTSPFWLSWIGASTTTNSTGRFTFDRLLYGRYVLLTQLPAAVYSGPVPLTGSGPGTLTVRPSAPPVDLGDIRLDAGPH
jgi:hypothetical protein